MKAVIQAQPPNQIRTTNDARVFAIIHRNVSLSRAQICTLTKLSKPTVLDIVDRLTKLELIEIVGQQPSTTPGPRAALYGIPANLGNAMGIELRRNSVHVQIQNARGEIVSTHEVEYGLKDSTTDDVRWAVDSAITRAGLLSSEILVAVIGAPGIVDPESGSFDSMDLPDWHVDLRAVLSQRLDCIIHFDNEVNLRALAEREIGAGVGVDNFVLLALGVGIGMGLIINGNLHRGRRGFAGEVGFQPLNFNHFVKAPHGRDYYIAGMQSLLGSESILALAKQHGFIEPDAAASISRAVQIFVAENHMGSTAVHEKQIAHDFLHELAARVVIGLGGPYTLLDPSLFILDGPTSLAGGDILCQLVREKLESLYVDAPLVKVSTVPGSTVLAGALVMAQQTLQREIFSQRGYNTVNLVTL